jgi:hypothetical protein
VEFHKAIFGGKNWKYSLDSGSQNVVYGVTVYYYKNFWNSRVKKIKDKK